MTVGTITRPFVPPPRMRYAHAVVTAKPAMATPVCKKVVAGVVAAFDAAILLASGLGAAALVRLDVSAAAHMAVIAALLGAVIGCHVWRRIGAYKMKTLSRFEHSSVLAVAGLAAVLAAQIALAAATGELTRNVMSWFYVWFALAAAALLAARAVVRMQISYWSFTGRLTERLAIVGATTIARRLLESLEAQARANAEDEPGARQHVVGIFDDRNGGVARSRDVYASVRGMEELADLISAGCVDAVIMAVPLDDEARFRALHDKLRHVAVDIRLCPDHLGLGLGAFSTSRCGGHTLLNVADKPLGDWRYVAKDMEDQVLGLMILALIAPVMAVIAVLIKLDSPGPVFFRQKRLGYNNRVIEVLKFRSMRQDMCDANAEKLATRDDPRITRIGAFLRRTSLDELPQFINVLRGEMSIVGPRPHALAAKAGDVVYPEAVEFYHARHRVKPGITGWAQVNGWRGETQTVEQIVRRVEHDLYYIDNWSVVMDIKIIIRTIFGGFTGKSAY